MTFWVPGAPIDKFEGPCPTEGCCAEDRCHICNDGVYVEFKTRGPDLNVSSVTAGELLRALGWPHAAEDGLYGELLPAAIPAARRSIVLALQPNKLRTLVQGHVEVTGARGAKFIGFARTEDRARELLCQLDNILVYGQEHNLKVSWG